MTRKLLPPLPNFRDWPYSHEELRARDLEVARIVLEAAAMLVEHEWEQCNEDAQWRYKLLMDAIRALEVSHD